MCAWANKNLTNGMLESSSRFDKPNHDLGSNNDMILDGTRTKKCPTRQTNQNSYLSNCAPWIAGHIGQSCIGNGFESCIAVNGTTQAIHLSNRRNHHTRHRLWNHL